jgi:hypothetical protein
MIGDRRLLLAATLGVALILAAAGSDLLTGSFWERHALIASLVANVLVVAVTVVVVNEVLDRRNQRRWNLLAQNVLFALLQSARATWTGLLEVLQVVRVESGDPEALQAVADVARDSARISEAIGRLLADDERRERLQRVCVGLGEHASEVIAKWAPVMLNARPYAEVLDRHVELAGRLEWIGSVLAHNEPAEGQSRRERTLARSSVATEHAAELGNDRWLHDQVLAVITLAVELDDESRALAYSIVPLSWWAERTAGLARNESPLPAPG